MGADPALLLHAFFSSTIQFFRGERLKKADQEGLSEVSRPFRAGSVRLGARPFHTGGSSSVRSLRRYHLTTGLSWFILEMRKSCEGIENDGTCRVRAQLSDSNSKRPP
jgi:hypothetical protein